MKNCLNDADMRPDNVNYINAHGTSTPAGDKVEVDAIEKLFQDSSEIFVSSTKSQTGHLLGAAGAVEAVYSILSLRNNLLPFTINLENQIKTNKVKFVVGSPMKKEVKAVMSNSFGFGGTNVSLIFSKFND